MKIRAQIISLVIGVAVLGLQACSRPLDPQESCNFVQNPELQRVSWQKRLPVKLYLHSSIPSTAYAAIDRAVNEYNLRLGGGREIFRVIARGASGDLNPLKDGYSMIYWHKSWDSSRPSEQARTTIYWTGVEIFEADIRINAANFSYHVGEETNFAHTDLTSLMVHEFGHVLGLAHSATPGSVMSFSLDEGEERRALSKADLENLQCEY